MIYPSYSTNVMTLGQALTLNNLLKRIYVKGQISSYPLPVSIDGFDQVLREKDSSYQFLEFEEFYKVYDEFYNDLRSYIENLKPGDKVVIEQRRHDSSWYPYSYVDDMAKYAGREFTIRRIGYVPANNERYCNGLDKCFILESCEGYNWHSSMFELPPKIPIKHLNLTEISIDPLSLI